MAYQDLYHGRAKSNVDETGRKNYPPRKPRLLDQVRNAIRRKHYSIRTEQSYIDWIKRYIFFHNKRHPKEMGERECKVLVIRCCKAEEELCEMRVRLFIDNIEGKISYENA